MPALSAIICLDNADNDKYNIDKNDLSQPVGAYVTGFCIATADSIFSLFYSSDRFSDSLFSKTSIT